MSTRTAAIAGYGTAWVAGNFQGFGGDSFNTIRNERGDIICRTTRSRSTSWATSNLNDRASLFGEFKYVTQETGTDIRPALSGICCSVPRTIRSYRSFCRTWPMPPVELAITVDRLFFDARRAGPSAIPSAFAGALKANSQMAGTMSSASTTAVTVKAPTGPARSSSTGFFAAHRCRQGPCHRLPACRADVDPNAPALNTPFEIPAYQAGYFSFTPGSGGCVPPEHLGRSARCLAGRGSLGDDAGVE